MAQLTYQVTVVARVSRTYVEGNKQRRIYRRCASDDHAAELTDVREALANICKALGAEPCLT